MDMSIKKVYILFTVICLSLVSVINVSCFLFGGAEEGALIDAAERQSEESSVMDEEVAALLENDDFLDVLHTFDYEDSIIKEASQANEDDSLLFILLESMDSFNDVEDHYKDLKVKSIWIRSEIYEKSSDNVEEEFLDSENENIPVSKFTYSNLEKDKVANVLIKGLEESRTQIMIIYWNLQ